MEKAEQRANLKYLQLIVLNRADEELPEVVEELRDALERVERTLTARAKRKGRDRQHRGGRDREA